MNRFGKLAKPLGLREARQQNHELTEKLAKLAGANPKLEALRARLNERKPMAETKLIDPTKAYLIGTSGLAHKMTVTVVEPPTAERPDTFLAETPGGKIAPIQVRPEAWVSEMRNLGEGPNKNWVDVGEQPGTTTAEKIASFVGTKGQLAVVDGSTSFSKEFPNGVFSMANATVAGKTPGDRRQYAADYHTKQAFALGMDHLGRLFPNMVNEKTNTLVSVPTVENWKHCFASSFDGRDRPVVNGARIDISAFIRVGFDLWVTGMMTGDQNIIEAAKTHAQAKREIFEVWGGDKDAPAELKPDEMVHRADERSLNSNIGDDVVHLPNGETVHTSPAYSAGYGIAPDVKDYQMTHSPRALKSILGSMKTFENHFSSKEGERIGWNRVIELADGQMNGSSERLGDLKNMVAWNVVDIVVASLFPAVAAFGQRRTNEPKDLTEARGLANQIIEKASDLITEHMYKPEQEKWVDELLNSATGKPITDWRWQQARAVVGHNLKIAWNLIRFKFHYETRAAEAAEAGDTAAAAKYAAKAARCREVSDRIYERVLPFARQHLTGLTLNVIEKNTPPGESSQHVWNGGNFWHEQQMQEAAAIKFADTGDTRYLNHADMSELVWSEAYLDPNNQGINFAAHEMTLDEQNTGDQAYSARPDMGYHQLERLEHMRQFYQLYKEGKPISVHFDMAPNRESNEVVAKFDTMPPGRFELGTITLNGTDYTPSASERANLQFTLPAFFNNVPVKIDAQIRPVRAEKEPAAN